MSAYPTSNLPRLRERGDEPRAPIRSKDRAILVIRDCSFSDLEVEADAASPPALVFDGGAEIAGER